MSTRLRIEALRKTFQGHTAIHGLDLRTGDGEFISLLGPSGCGKTTTLRCVAGFEQPDAGRIWLDDQDITEMPAERRDIGMVFQNYALFPHLTVQRNLAFGLEMRRVPAAEVRRRVDAVLGMVQLAGLADRYPRQLSGGQQQRVALARALVVEPRMLLLDEPLANLDAVLREDMRVFIRELQRRVGITTLYVTHDQSEAMLMSDRVAVMLAGRLLQFDAPEAIYLRPASAEVARFIGRSNLIDGRVARADAAHCVVETALGLVGAGHDRALAAGEPVQITVRPEAIRFDAAGPYEGAVQTSYFLGSTVEHSVRCGVGQVLLIHTVPGERVDPGVGIRFRIAGEQAWVVKAAA